MKSLFIQLMIIYAVLATPIDSRARNLVRDSALATVGKANGAWRVQLHVGGVVRGQKQTLTLKAATIAQDVHLNDGLYELTVKASGRGELVLRVAGTGSRSQFLTPQQSLFGYLFETAGGPAAVEIEVEGDSRVTDVELQPATPAQHAAWEMQRRDIAQFGFITHSAQRPAPGCPVVGGEGEGQPLAAMARRAVLDEPRLNCSHVQNESRLLAWLGDHGFVRLNAEKLAAWMRQRIEQKDAYGSVVVLAKGVGPTNLTEPADKPLWLEYVRAGGRLVSVGGLPLYNTESPVVAPLPAKSADTSALAVLEIPSGWSSPYWGKNVPVQATSGGRRWRFETADTSICGAPVECVTIAFEEYAVAGTGKKGTGRWFKNVRPDLPWSGLLQLLFGFNGNNDAMLRDVWRAASFVGKPLTIPAIPPVKVEARTPIQVECTAGGMKGRREFVRGETVEVNVTAVPVARTGRVRLELLSHDQVLWSETLPMGRSFTVPTQPYAYGDYRLKATVWSDATKRISEAIPIGIRYIPPETFNWEVIYSAGPNRLRSEQEAADIRKTGFEVLLGEVTPAGIDLLVRHGLGFSLRAMESPSNLLGRPSIEKHPQYFRLDPQGKPIGTAYSGGRPAPGISHPDVRRAFAKFIQEQVDQVAGIPAFRPYTLCNDDFSAYYGWDYAAHVVRAFKQATGLDAPRTMTKPGKYGPLTESHPWVEWFRWTLINVAGRLNKAETQGAVQSRSDVRVGPIPGGMQIPFVMLWQPSQYPPYNFGANGFNLLCSYYYNSYWQPIMTSTFWMEIGRMGNRDLPQWNMPDCYQGTGGYVRNNFFHYLAGGIKGLVYFVYSQRNAPSWSELASLSQIVERIGPVQVRLAAARRDIGLLNSFTSNCFDPGHTLIQVYGYHNLMQGHFDLEMVSEDEIAAGRAERYKAVVLYDIQYLDAKAYEQIKQYAARGGLVLLDTSIPFEIPGAKRLAVDLGMGQEKTRSFPTEGAHVSTPGPKDYGIPSRVQAIQRAVSRYVKPYYDCPDIHLVYKRFECEGIPYTWFINAQDGKEFQFARERHTAKEETKFKELLDWEARNVDGKPYAPTIIRDRLEGIPYDLIRQRPLAVQLLSDGRWSVALTMERWGGSLVVWLPEEVVGLTLKGSEAVSSGQTWRAIATVNGKTRPVPGVVPVKFILADPQGQTSAVSGTRGTQKGQAAFEWTPAINDPAGTWTLTVTEGLTGKSVIQKVRFSGKNSPISIVDEKERD